MRQNKKNMQKNYRKPPEPTNKNKYCYQCKENGHWKRDCKENKSNQVEKTFSKNFQKNIKKEYKEGKIAKLTTIKSEKIEKFSKTKPKEIIKLDKSIQTEKTDWEIQIEENSKNEILKIGELNEEKLQHQITKNTLEFTIYQRNIERKHFYQEKEKIKKKEKYINMKNTTD